MLATETNFDTKKNVLRLLSCNMVEIDHGNGFVTRYAHAQEIHVELGQKVTAGETIAIMGKTGRATSEHLHFLLVLLSLLSAI